MILPFKWTHQIIFLKEFNCWKPFNCYEVNEYSFYSKEKEYFETIFGPLGLTRLDMELWAACNLKLARVSSTNWFEVWQKNRRAGPKERCFLGNISKCMELKVCFINEKLIWSVLKESP